MRVECIRAFWTGGDKPIAVGSIVDVDTVTGYTLIASGKARKAPDDQSKKPTVPQPKKTRRRPTRAENDTS